MQKAASIGSCEFHSHWRHLIVPPNIVGDGDIIIGKDVHFWGSVNMISSKKHYNDCSIIICDETEIGDNVSIRSYMSVRIGKKCLIGSGVRIFDFNGHPISSELRRIGWRNGAYVPKEEIKAVEIGENVWIGENSFIHPGVKVGNNTIIAAGSNVTKNLPEDVIAMGSPARVCGWLNKNVNTGQTV